MSTDFGLFSLHKKDDVHPRSWICAQGKTLVEVVRELEENILTAHGISREHLSNLLSEELRCARGVVKNLLRGGSHFYPIVVLERLIARSTKPETFRTKIERSIVTLKVNSASAKPVRAVSILSNDLAKIIGAFAADGSLSVQLILAATTQPPLEKLRQNLKEIVYSLKIRWSGARKQYYMAIQLNEHTRNLLDHLGHYAGRDLLTQTHYAIELTDEYEDSVRAFAKWMKTVFDVEPTSLNIRRGKRAWRVIFSNKIVARYLTEFFGMESGLKTFTVHEPDMIKNSKLEMRRNFARGALMFDGCVTKGGKVTFSSKSRDFATSIQDIWAQDKIAHGVLTRNRRGEYIISTILPNRLNNLLKYFEPDTQKWKLLRWVNGNKEIAPIIKESGALSIEKILLLLRDIKSCDMSFLEQHFQRRYTSIRHYLKILTNQRKISISTKPHVWSDCISGKAKIYLNKTAHALVFTNIKQRLGLGDSVAKALGVHKSTFSAWKHRKNKIPVGIIRRLCPLLGFNFRDLAKSITRTDRDIVELI